MQTPSKAANDSSTDNSPGDKAISPVKKRRATSYDVALQAGVSQSAVSRCFTPGASISDVTRGKIETAAKHLGYQPNAIARGLITRRSNMVAVIIADMTNLNYPQLLSELSLRLVEKDFHILLFTLRKETDVDHILNQIWQYQIDGIIAAAQFSSDQINSCNNRGIPLVFYNWVYADSRVCSVCCDHEAGERLLIENLIDDGREAFVVMSGPVDSALSTARTRGAINKLNEQSARVLQVAGDYSYDRACQLVREILNADKFRPDAIICANDTMAFGCIDTLRHEYSISVPGQIAVVGFDGVAAAHWASYDLTTVEQPVERMVEATIHMLLERIDNPRLPAEKRFLGGKLVEGSSARFE